jgi:mannose-6-phosphate isomerase-like protein (cupin superfamily)
VSERSVDGDLGGEAPCWAHLVDDAGHLDHAGAASVVVDLGAIDVDGASGAVWSLPHGGDLDANIVHLHPTDAIGEHANDEVDVLIVVLAGNGTVSIDGTSHALRPGIAALVPRAAVRAITPGVGGVTYLSVHRRRGALRISG